MFTLRLLGYDRTRNYDGSMGEWANRDDRLLRQAVELDSVLLLVRRNRNSIFVALKRS